MYDKESINRLCILIKNNDGIANKNELAKLVSENFNMALERKVYYCDSFAIRFSKSKSIGFSNTVLSISALQKYDNKPFFVCVVTPEKNFILMANTTFLKKISHSSKEFRMDNIKGSFNGGDIAKTFNGLTNSPENFEKLYAYHVGVSFQDNLERLVEATNGIVGRTKKFNISSAQRQNILNSIINAKEFVLSKEFFDLKNDLDERVSQVQKEIAIAARIDNINIRGRIIEYLITNNGSSLKNKIICALNNNNTPPDFKTEDKLGDYSKCFDNFYTETDIKTKIMSLHSNPKAYNIDKMLEFLSGEKSVYMIYLVGIKNRSIVTKLCSVFDKRIINSTNIVHHWSGRNTRGVAQFMGTDLENIINSDTSNHIDEESARLFLNKLMEL